MGKDRERRPCAWFARVGIAALGLPACGELQQASGQQASDESGGTTGAVATGSPSGSEGDDGPSAVTTSTTAPPPDDTATGGPPPDTTGGPAPTCGDGTVDPGEACDDANADETDDCTSLCAVPSCDDGMKDGQETDVDCGASCDGCLVTQGCAASGDCEGGLVCGTSSLCVWPPSCLSLLEAWPETPDGSWPLDPDGDGISAPFTCDMDGGGWTRVLAEDFASSDGTTWDPQHPITTCGTYGMILGGANQFSGITVSRDVPLYGIPHTEARLGARVVKIDSWDNESVTARIDGAAVWQVQHAYTDGPNHQCGDAQWNETEDLMAGIVGHGAATMTLAFEGMLNQGPENEAWGVDDIEVWVR